MTQDQQVEIVSLTNYISERTSEIESEEFYKLWKQQMLLENGCLELHYGHCHISSSSMEKLFYYGLLSAYRDNLFHKAEDTLSIPSSFDNFEDIFESLFDAKSRVTEIIEILENKES